MPDDASPPPTTKPLDEIGGRALVEAWRASGLNGAAFCRERQVRPQRLHYWRERLGYPVKVIAGQPRPQVERPPTTEGFVQVVVSGSPASATTAVDIVVGAAVVRVRPGFDAELLRAVVVALA